MPNDSKANLFRWFKITKGLELNWIAYGWGQIPERIYPLVPHERAGVHWQLLKHLAKIALSFKSRLRFPHKKISQGEIIFFANAVNQLWAIAPIQKKTPGSKLWVDGNLAGDYLFPSDAARIIGLFFLPKVLWDAITGRSGIKLWTFNYGLSGFLDAYGYFFLGARWLEKSRPQALVVANDSSPQARSLIFAARLLSIPTYYVQHAPVNSKTFPPLEVDYALLDGVDAKEKYRLRNPSCQIHLVGMARRSITSDTFNRNVSAPPKNKIGLGLTDNDTLEDIEAVSLELKENFPQMKVVLRPHPLDTKMEKLRALAKRLDFQFSEPSQVSPWKFLEDIDFLVAGVSGILLDAAFSGVLPFQHERLANGYDHYEQRGTGSVIVIRSAAEIREKLATRSELTENLLRALQRYDSTFGTDSDGKAPEIAADIISQTINQRLGSLGTT